MSCITLFALLATWPILPACGADAPIDTPEVGVINVLRAPEIGQEKWTFDDYRIANGDLLDISVWRVEDLQLQIVVRPDGKISFPLIGDVKASSSTIAELSEELVKRLKVFIKNPQVSVIVKGFGGRRVIVMGEVSSKGMIRFTEPVRVMDVLALSGGTLESACLTNVLVIRGDLRKNTDVIVVDVSRILQGHFDENIYVDTNDIVYVPRSIIGNIAYLIRQIGPLFGASELYRNAGSEALRQRHRTWIETGRTN